MEIQYHIPPGLLVRIGLSCLWLSPRNFRADALECLSNQSRLPQVSGAEHIPASGPFLVTFNHYYRPGLNIIWMAMALAAALPAELSTQARFIMIGELTYPGRWYAPLGRPVSRFVLKRLAHIYGFITMPPMPPREKDVAQRATSVRAVLSWVELASQPVLLMAPEGGDQPGGRLARPPAGVGRFIGLLAARGLSILPAAGWEQGNTFQLRFGPAYQLSIPGQSSRNEVDQAASSIVMRAIADLLPETWRGVYP